MEGGRGKQGGCHGDNNVENDVDVHDAHTTTILLSVASNIRTDDDAHTHRQETYSSTHTHQACAHVSNV